MPFADLIFDGQDRFSKSANDCPATSSPRCCLKKELSITSATDSATFDDISTSLYSTDQKAKQETNLTLIRDTPTRSAAESSAFPKVDNFSMKISTIHRPSTLGGTKQIIVLDPHLISLDRLGPSSLEAKGIEIATRPSSYFRPGGGDAHSETMTMVPRTIRIRSPLRPILKLTSSTYNPPAPFKQVRFDVSISHTGDNYISNSDECKEAGLLSEDDGQSLWWTKEELKELEIREWYAARNLVRSAPRFAEAFERILLECFKSIEKDPKLSKEQLEPHGGLGLTCEEALKMMMSHDCRGLERSMVHWLSVGAAKHYFYIKKKCTVALMKAQSRWRNVDQTPQVKVEKIASAIRNYSLFAERLAQLLAEGDAAALQESDDLITMCPIEHSNVSHPFVPKGRIVL